MVNTLWTAAINRARQILVPTDNAAMLLLGSLVLTFHGSLEDKKPVDWETIAHSSTKLREWVQMGAPQWILGCLLDDWTGDYTFARLRLLEELEPSPQAMKSLIRYVASCSV